MHMHVKHIEREFEKKVMIQYTGFITLQMQSIYTVTRFFSQTNAKFLLQD